MQLNYWIEVKTPQGSTMLWSSRVPTEAFQLFKKLGFSVQYGREGQNASRSFNAHILRQPIQET